MNSFFYNFLKRRKKSSNIFHFLREFMVGENKQNEDTNLLLNVLG